MRLLTYPSDGTLLRRTARLVREDEFGTEELIEFGKRLGGVMLDNGGAGLAATQVDEAPGGEAWAMFALATGPGAYGIVCNPEIVLANAPKPGREGCLSFASVSETMLAPEFVLLRGFNPQGKLFEMGVTDEQARCVVHECDHLKGRLLIDRMSPTKRKMFLQKVTIARSKRPQVVAEYRPQGA